MGWAMLYPEPESHSERAKKGGEAKAEKGKKAASSETEQAEQPKPLKPSGARLSLAHRVLRHSRDLAQMVMAKARGGQLCPRRQAMLSRRKKEKNGRPARHFTSLLLLFHVQYVSIAFPFENVRLPLGGLPWVCQCPLLLSGSLALFATL